MQSSAFSILTFCTSSLLASAALAQDPAESAPATPAQPAQPAETAQEAPAEEEEQEAESKLKSATFAGLEMRGIGPALMSGRIADIAIHP